MKPSYARRARRNRNVSRSEGSFFKKESSETGFFDAAVASPFFSASPVSLQRKCDKCEEEEKKPAQMKKDEDKKVQRKEGAAPAAGVSTSASVKGALSSGGQSLPVGLAYYFSSRMGRDIGGTKIHTGAQAEASAKNINAKAYTVGNHIVFGEGQYQPDTYEGKKLLAHELAHVVQQQNSERLSRKTDDAGVSDVAEPLEEETPLPPISTSGVGTSTSNKTAYGNCEGVSVQGLTTANYDHGGYSVSGAAVTRAQNCAGCTGDDCVTIRGTIVSVYRAAPTVSLPGVPPNKNECETQAIQNFINTTLSQHEQQHVTAFHTYDGTVNTPFTYTGCRDGMDGYVAGIHNGIEAGRVASANALSDALDANGANIFTITCDCPDPAPAPEPDAGS